MKRRFTGVFTAIAAVALAVFLCGCTNVDAYIKTVEDYGIFTNTAADALPQTAFRDIAVKHFNEPLAEGKIKKKALILTLDGMRADAFQFIKDYQTGVMGLKDEADGGIYLAYCGGQSKSYRTDTAPGTVSLLTGKWADEVGVLKNTDEKDVLPKSLFSDAAEAGLSVRLNVGWATHINTTFKKEIDAQKAAVGGNAGQFDAVSAPSDSALQTQILQSILRYDVTIGLYAEPDGAGHGFGFDPSVAEYAAAVVNTNALIGEAIATVKARPQYATEDWLILISTDHGGQKDKNHYQATITERLIFIATNKMGNYTDYLQPGYQLH